MKLTSYFNPSTNVVQIRLASDAAPASPFVALGAVTHEPVNDNLSGAQKYSVSHVIFQHVQEQLYLKYKIQDMGIIRITTGGAFVLLQSFRVERTQPTVKPGGKVTVKAVVLPANATVDGYYVSADNPDLVTIAAGGSANEFVVTLPKEGDVLLTVGIKNTDLFETIPVSAQIETRATN